MRVLLVEDNPGDVRLLQVMLAEAGAARFKVTHADRLATGLQRLGERSIEVVLLDLSLPDSHGLGTLVRMQVEAKGVPIVVLTGLEDEALGITLVQAGAQDYLVKGQLTGPLLVRSLHYAIERKRAEEERTRLAHDRLLLLESTGEGIYGIDAQGRCTFINQSAARMFGYEPDELLGKDLHELIHHSRPDGSPYPVGECPIYRAFRTGQGCRVDDEVLWRRDGTAFPADYSSSPIRAGGVIKGAVVTFTDITARKRAEQALQESQGALQRSHEELRALAAQLLTAQEEKRRRISRDLHDDLNQKLALLAVEAEALAQHLPRAPELIIERLQTLRNRVVELTEDVRRLAYQLHPSIMKNPALPGGVS